MPTYRLIPPQSDGENFVITIIPDSDELGSEYNPVYFLQDGRAAFSDIDGNVFLLFVQDKNGYGVFLFQSHGSPNKIDLHGSWDDEVGGSVTRYSSCSSRDNFIELPRQDGDIFHFLFIVFP